MPNDLDTTGVEIRTACADDLPALTSIYNHYVTETHVTFDREPFSVEERRKWMGTFAQDGPYRLLVAATPGEVVGYASSGRHRGKPGYDTSVETTIYLAPDAGGLGIGRRLYGALLEALSRVEGVHRAYGGIALPNDPSIRLHEALGYRHLGTFSEVGLKFGKYWDVAWYEKALGAPPSTPRPSGPRPRRG